MTRHRGRSGRQNPMTMRAIEADVRRTVSPTARYDDLGPGDFADDMRVLRHPSGELLELAEWDVALEDALTIVRSGADVYVNPEDLPWHLGERAWPSDRQTWLLGPEAHLLEQAVPLVGKNHARIRISLYKSENGVLTVHVTGAFRWPDPAPPARTS